MRKLRDWRHSSKHHLSRLFSWLGLRLRHFWHWLPLPAKLHGLWSITALALLWAVAVLDIQDEVVVADFALPAAPPSLAWHDEVSEFANRMQLVFGVRAEVAQEFSAWILEASRRQDLQPELIASMVFTESSFRKQAVSHVGALGPAQVRPYWQSFCATPNLHDPAENIYCGAQILSHFRDTCGNETCALKAYNLGPRGMQQERFASAGVRYVTRVGGYRELFDSLNIDSDSASL